MQNVKGTYDYFGKEQALRKQVQSVLRNMFELYDYDEMDSTILNELDLLTSKYTGGDEIVKEMYQFSDQGNRSLGLRYDLTIPFAKVIALNPGIELPFRRYEIGKVFRDGPVKRGRLREFLQCDVDVVGIAGPEAEAELMQLAVEAFRKLDIAIVLKWNNRRFLGEVLERIGVLKQDLLSVMLTLDKIAKIGSSGVIAELRAKGLEDAVTNTVMELIQMDNPTFERICEKYGLQNKPGTLEVTALMELIQDIGLEQVCIFDPFLSRGLSFYTGTVYEIFDAANNFTSSLGGGGRYDAIIGQLVGREDIQYPTVGLSFGMESIMEMLEGRQIETAQAAVVIIPIGNTLPSVLNTAAQLRKNEIRVSCDTSGRKLKKSLASVSAKGIPFVILIGEDEAAQDMIQVKDMSQNTSYTVTVDEAIHFISKCEI
ncbi:histidine--tRNA ligase [Paenibacillus marinisediminis]